MSKITKTSNYRVVIEPRGLGNFGSISVSDSMFYKDEEKRQKAYKERCEEIIDQVKRHVDNCGYVQIEYDTDEVCSFCGYGWEVDESGCPVCCTKAEEEFKSSAPSPTGK